MPKPLSIEEKLRRFPPTLVRMLARVRPEPKHENPKPRLRALLTAEIIDRSGLSAFEVASLSMKPSWEGVSVDAMQKFLLGCNARWDDRVWLHDVAAVQRSIIRRKGALPFYLLSCPEWETVLKKIVETWK